MEVPSSVQLIPQMYTEFKFWSTVIGGFWMLFKGFTWVKAIKETDLANLHKGIAKVETEIQSQTTSIVSAMDKNTSTISELRGDIKLLFIAPPRARAARAARRKKK